MTTYIGISDLLTNMNNSTSKKDLENNYQEVKVYIASLDLVNDIKQALLKTANMIHTSKCKQLAC